MRLALACRAPAKINLGLKITGRYENGYHRLESVFVPVSVFDRISVTTAPTDTVKHIWPGHLTPLERQAIAAGALSNPLLLTTLVWVRDYLKTEHAFTLPQLAVRVEKQIPSPGGLGGASADAAALIAALLGIVGEEKFSAEFIRATEKLGADIPFFLGHGLRGKAAILNGAGHELYTAEIPLLHGWICVPPFGFPTRQMFAEVRRWDLPAVAANSAANAASSQSNLTLRLNEIPYSDEPIRGVRLVRNDFDAAARTVFPGKSRELDRAKIVIAQAAKQFFPGEWVVGMTGSGAGLFAASDLAITMPELTKLLPLLKARLGLNWRVMPFRNIGP